MRAIKLTLLALFGMTAVAFAQKAKEPAPFTPPTVAMPPSESILIGKIKEAGQPPAKSSLEELLAKALQHSPEVQVAEAKLREAEAQLRQTRLQVAQKMVEMQASMELQQHVLSNTEADYKRVAQMHERGAISSGELSEAERRLLAVKGQLAQVEAQVNALTGRLPALANLAANFGGGGVGAGTHYTGVQPAQGALGGGPDGPPADAPKRMPVPPMAQRMRKALDQSMKLSDKKIENLPLKEVIELVRQQVPSVPFLVKVADRGDNPINIDFKGDLTLASAFQLLCDSVPGLRVVVRDYGFMVTFDDDLPEHAMDVVEFSSQKP